MVDTSFDAAPQCELFLQLQAQERLEAHQGSSVGDPLFFQGGLEVLRCDARGKHVQPGGQAGLEVLQGLLVAPLRRGQLLLGQPDAL